MQFVDLKLQYEKYKKHIDKEIAEVIETTSFIKGPKVAELEEKLARFVGVKHCIGCASGTDALTISLMAKDIKKGDEVIVPDFTFIATAETVSQLGATPIFCDINPVTFNIKPQKIENCITDKTKGIIVVSMFGQVADLKEIKKISKEYNLWVIEDAAQSFGAKSNGRKSCSLTEIATTSFFPAKPFGCYGDGGAIFTDDAKLAEKIRIIANHGQKKRYVHSMIGINGRLDTIQAAVLLAKLPFLNQELKLRNRVVKTYIEHLKDEPRIVVPKVKEDFFSVWAQFTVRVKDRDRVRESLQKQGIPTAVHYPIPLHKQMAFCRVANNDNDYPESIKASKEVLSLPMHPFLEESEIKKVCDALKEAVNEK